MEQQENLCRIGLATYVIDRVFISDRKPQEVVVEEIITTARQAINFDHSDRQMIKYVRK